MNHHISWLEASAAAPVSMTIPMHPCSRVFVSRYSFKNKQGGTASQVMTQENAFKCSYKIQNLLKTQTGNSKSITGAIAATGLNFLSTSHWIKTFPVLASPLLMVASAEERSFLILFIIIFAWTSVCFSLKGYIVIHTHPDPATNLQFSLNCSQFEILDITGRNGSNSYSLVWKL